MRSVMGGEVMHQRDFSLGSLDQPLERSVGPSRSFFGASPRKNQAAKGKVFDAFAESAFPPEADPWQDQFQQNNLRPLLEQVSRAPQPPLCLPKEYCEEYYSFVSDNPHQSVLSSVLTSLSEQPSLDFNYSPNASLVNCVVYFRGRTDPIQFQIRVFTAQPKEGGGGSRHNRKQCVVEFQRRMGDVAAFNAFFHEFIAHPLVAKQLAFRRAVWKTSSSADDDAMFSLDAKLGGGLSMPSLGGLSVPSFGNSSSDGYTSSGSDEPTKEDLNHGRDAVLTFFGMVGSQCADVQKQAVRSLLSMAAAGEAQKRVIAETTGSNGCATLLDALCLSMGAPDCELRRLGATLLATFTAASPKDFLDTRRALASSAALLHVLTSMLQGVPPATGKPSNQNISDSDSSDDEVDEEETGRSKRGARVTQADFAFLESQRQAAQALGNLAETHASTLRKTRWAPGLSALQDVLRVLTQSGDFDIRHHAERASKALR